MNNSSLAPSKKPMHWYLLTAVLLLLLSAFFRLWDLGATPPGMHAEELINVQLSDYAKQGNIAVIYDEVSPAREGFYYAFLAVVNTIIGRGLILWRLPSVWISLLALSLTTHLMRRLYGIRISLMTLGLMAVTFWSVWLGRTVQHIILLPVVTTFVVYAFFRAFGSQKTTEASLWFTAGGIGLGFAQYIHVIAWTLIVLYALFIIYQLIVSWKNVQKHRANIIFSLFLALVLMLPLLIFLGRHPGIREPVPLAEQPQLLAEIPGRLISSIGALFLRGDMLPYHNLPGRPIFGPIIGVLMILGIGISLSRWKDAQYGLALLWLLVGLLPTAFLPQQPDFEYMAVILPIVFVFPAIGLRSLLSLLRQRTSERVSRLSNIIISMFVVALITGNALWTYRDYFITWPSLGDVRLNYQADLGIVAHYLDTNPDPLPVSVCSTLGENNDQFDLTTKELLSYLMHNSNKPIRYFDCSQSLVLANGGSSQHIIFPREHYYDHLPDALLKWMRYAQDENAENIRPDVIMHLDAVEEFASFAGAFTSEANASLPPEATQTGVIVLPASFGYNIAFLGYEIHDEHLAPGEWLEVTTYWRLDGPPPDELTVFVHLLGNPLVVIAQRDGLGVEINTLATRDVFIQHSLVQIPQTIVAGEYQISVGLYLSDPSMRLPVFINEEAVANRLFLRSITIE